MTEDTGFPQHDEFPPDVTEPAPEAPAEPPADEPVAAEPEPAEDVTEPSAPVAPTVENPPQDYVPPFIPDTGVADWLRELLTDLHRRLFNLGK